MAVANTGTVFAPSFLVFCGLRFLTAIRLAGIILTSRTLSESLARPTSCPGGGDGAQGPPARALAWMHLQRLSAAEWTTTRRRALTLPVLGGTYCTGQVVGGVAFALRDGRVLHLAVAMPFFAIFPISW